MVHRGSPKGARERALHEVLKWLEDEKIIEWPRVVCDADKLRTKIEKMLGGSDNKKGNKMSLDLNELAVEISKREGLKEQVNIAQIK